MSRLPKTGAEKMNLKKAMCSLVGYGALVLIGLLAIPAGLLWGAITLVWNGADLILQKIG